MPDFTYASLVFASLLTILALGFWAGYNKVSALKKHAVELQCAQYNPITGEFEWKAQEKK